MNTDRLRFLFPLCAVALSTSSIVAGCGGGNEDTYTDGAGGEDGDGPASGGKGTGGKSGAGSGGKGSGTGGDETGSGGTGGIDPDSYCGSTFEEPIIVELSAPEPQSCNLPHPTESADYFQFSGVKGTTVVVLITAKTGEDPFDPTYVDTVVTLHDEAGNPIAQNGNPTPMVTSDSLLVTVLPYTGTFTVEVQECNAVFGADSCAPAEDIETTDYEVVIAEPNPDSVDMASASNESIATASGVIYDAAPQGGFYLEALGGGFENASDVDYFSILAPAFSLPSGTRLALSFFPVGGGPTGNGSTAEMGLISLLGSDGVTVLAQLDPSKGGSLEAPVTSGQQYYLSVAAGALGVTNDFYFINLAAGSANHVETANATNDDPSTPEPIGSTVLAGYVASYFIEGNISTLGDLDYWSMVLPAGSSKASVACNARRRGSGLRDLQVSLTGSDGTTLLSAAATATETASADGALTDIAVTAGGPILLKVQAGSQDGTVTGTYYSCGVLVK